MLPPVGIEPGNYPFYTNLTFACKTLTLGSLNSYALLILLKSSKSKHQVVHQQKFKDLLSSTCQVSVERDSVGLGIRGYERPGFCSRGGGVTFCHWMFFT